MNTPMNTPMITTKHTTMDDSANGPPYDTQPLEFLAYLYNAAVARAQAAKVLPSFLPKPPQGRTLVVGAGKAAAAMAQALDAAWPQDAPLSGLVVTRYGHIPPIAANATANAPAARIEVLEAAHPVPDAAGVQASERMLSLCKGLTTDDLVIALISGGGSSLLSLPIDGVSLADKQRINKALLASGASIDEMNTVRKHLSRIKGGQLAAACAPASVVTLAISDVPGDDVAVIASGPTVLDTTTAADALAIAARYGIDLPFVTETPKNLAQGEVHLIATPMQSLLAAKAACEAVGLPAYILSDDVEGESREVGKVHAAIAKSIAKGQGAFVKPCVILSGGETTVTLKPLPEGTLKGQRGRGGRAGEFCLGLAQGLQGAANIWALAADTDGIDGVEDNAGAFVRPDTVRRADALGHRLQDHLSRNDAYGYFAALGDLFITGPTHTNVNDFRAILVLEDSADISKNRSG